MSDHVILEWGRDSVRVLVVSEELTRRSVKLAASTSFVDHTDMAAPAQDAGLALRGWLDKAGVPSGRCTVVLPRESVVLRRLTVPHVPADELPDIVRFQAATKSSAPIDNLALDYLAVPGADAAGGQTVITLTVDRTQIERMTKVLNAAGLQLEHIRVSPLTVAQVVRASGISDLGAANPDLMIYQQGNRLEFSIFDQGTLIFSHGLELSAEAEADALKPLKSELTRSIVALNQVHPNASIERCVYVAGHSDPAVVQLLQQRFPRGFQQVNSAHVLKGIETPGYEPLTGAALPQTDEGLRLDLLHPRRKIERPDRRKWYYAAAGGVAVVALLLGYSMFSSTIGGLEEQIEGLNQQIASIDQKLNAGKPQAASYEYLAKWKEKDADPIELWNTLKRYLPGTDRLYFTELTLFPQEGKSMTKFVGKGRAKSNNDVYQLTQVLSENGFVVTPKTPTTGGGDAGYPVQFDFDVELLRPAPAPAAPAMSTPSLPTAQITR